MPATSEVDRQFHRVRRSLPCCRSSGNLLCRHALPARQVFVQLPAEQCHARGLLTGLTCVGNQILGFSQPGGPFRGGADDLTASRTHLLYQPRDIATVKPGLVRSGETERLHDLVVLQPLCGAYKRSHSLMGHDAAPDQSGEGVVQHVGDDEGRVIRREGGAADAVDGPCYPRCRMVHRVAQQVCLAVEPVGHLVYLPLAVLHEGDCSGLVPAGRTEHLDDVIRVLGWDGRHELHVLDLRYLCGIVGKGQLHDSLGCRVLLEAHLVANQGVGQHLQGPDQIACAALLTQGHHTIVDYRESSRLPAGTCGLLLDVLHIVDGVVPGIPLGHVISELLGEDASVDEPLPIKGICPLHHLGGLL